MLPYPIVDAWVNPNLGTPANPRYTLGYLFPELAERWERGTTVSQMIDEMDEGNVGLSVLCMGYGGVEGVDDERWVLDAVDAHPDRFVASLAVDPRRAMAAVNQVERMVRDHHIRMIRVVPFEIGVSYDDPMYYPIYAKCAELGVPIGINVGIPGPLLAGAVQDPLHLDKICAFFPELTVIMQHGGDPWIDLCVKLLLKWPNLHYMTSAWSPKRVPEAIIRFANSRLGGSDKVMFASDYPLLTFSRCAAEIEKMPFKLEQTRRKFARGNALRVICGIDDEAAE